MEFNIPMLRYGCETHCSRGIHIPFDQLVHFAFTEISAREHLCLMSPLKGGHSDQTLNL